LRWIFFREYIDVLKAALTSGGGSDLKYDDAKVYASTENLSKSAGEAPGSHSSTLSELGRLLLQVRPKNMILQS